METGDLNFLDTLLPLAMIIFIIGLGVVLLYLNFQKNLSAQKLRQEALKSRHQHELLRVSIDAQEEERRRMAQDLHDELGAVLSMMRMNLVMLEQAEGNKDNLSGLQNVRGLSETALTSVRSISHRLMPPQLQLFGLVKTLESVTDQLSSSGGIDISLAVDADPGELPWALSLGLYRMIMELISNTVKHAGASSIQIRLDRDKQDMMCNYTDNGKGLAGADLHAGLGLKSVEGRASSLDGTFTFGTASQGGFFALIRVPVPLQSEAQ